ncbi:MAG: alkaline phosphatase D family protein [Hyphomonadaceae bacterium]|nr:alkaline phosphatase D family protein [Hyphomonadaceae bacterium]
MLVTRRSMLIAASLAAAPTPAWARRLSSGQFTHGVASGDPLPRAVILWTRFAPAPGGDGRIAYEVSEQEDFRRVVKRGAATAGAANDYCVKVDVRGLRPGRIYYYRFLAGGGPSPTGITRTAPDGPTDSLSFAFFSCCNYPFGYFHAYAHAAARSDVDIAIHVGDYIYEYAKGYYPSAEETAPGRVLEPVREVVTYAEYCQRYALYHADPDLQELRRLKPLSVVWDDHELANDTYKDGAQNHQAPAEGTWADRLAAASKAYFDWTPIRLPERTGPRIYRSLDWGDLARIVLLDTRYIGRDKQLDYRTDLMPLIEASGGDMAAAVARFRREKLDVETRQLLGAAQEQWMAGELAGSKARGQAWQVLAQQIVIGRQNAPPEMLNYLPAGLSAGSRRWFESGVQMSALGLPWNLDAWGGYPKAQERFLAACAAQGANALVLAGDSHNCWVSNLPAARETSSGGRNAAIEFAGGSVSSPGFESTLTNAQPGQREASMRGANPTMAFCDVTNRGYGKVKLTRGACEAEWVAFPSIRERTAPAPIVSRFSSQASASAGPGAWAVG